MHCLSIILWWLCNIKNFKICGRKLQSGSVNSAMNSLSTPSPENSLQSKFQFSNLNSHIVLGQFTNIITKVADQMPLNISISLEPQCNNHPSLQLFMGITESRKLDTIGTGRLLMTNLSQNFHPSHVSSPIVPVQFDDATEKDNDIAIDIKKTFSSTAIPMSSTPISSTPLHHVTHFLQDRLLYSSWQGGRGNKNRPTVPMHVIRGD